MKKILSSVVIALTFFSTALATTFRVNNVPGSGAQFTNFADAQEAASDGDVIIFDGSKTSYGDIEITKKLTIKGPGFFLDGNKITSEGYECAEFDKITVKAEGTVLSGVVLNNATVGKGISLEASEVVVTRCYVGFITVCEPYSYTQESISNCIIHQNFIIGGISGDSYSAPANYMQITNNIFWGINCIANLNKSTISHNTVVFGYDISFRQLTDCIYEYNISPIPGDYWANKNNTVRENIEIESKRYSVYKDCKFDGDIKEMEAGLQPVQGVCSHGAFSGNDPYVLSGLTTGPRIQDIEMPESVVQGDNMNVTIKIGVSR